MDTKNETKVEAVAPSKKAITPSDTKELATTGRIVVTKAGNLRVTVVGDPDSLTNSYNDCQVGFSPPCEVRMVHATGTTATVELA